MLKSHLKTYHPFLKDYYTTLENNKKYKDVKLVATFHPRVEYVTHFKNLKLYLQLGMKLKKIHRVLKFRQENFIAPFIEQCTLSRQLSKTKFEQDQFKKVANSVYGKTIQNVRNYIEVKLHKNLSSLQRAISSHTFKNYSIIRLRTCANKSQIGRNSSQLDRSMQDSQFWN